MVSMAIRDDFKNLLVKIIILLLIIPIGLLEVVDAPEDLENTLNFEQSPSVNIALITPTNTKTLIDCTNINFTNTDERANTYFNEDNILTWLTLQRFRASVTRTNNDDSAIEYRSFYSLGNLNPRYRTLARYRDFLDLFIQQYGRSIH